VPAKIIRAAIVGASGILGKELADELNASPVATWDLALFDAGDASGQVTAAGDEPMVIQEIGPVSFVGVDVVFFAGDAATTRKHWKDALTAGAGIIDLSYALESEKGALVRCPLIETAAVGTTPSPDLTTKIIVPAHPAAVMLALVADRLRARWKTARLVATVLEPASQLGREGLEELHQQTVATLSFQALPRDVYDAQVSFNLNAELGAAAKLDLYQLTAQMRRHFEAIAGEEAVQTLALQLLQAPVFNGYTASVFALLDDSEKLVDVVKALQGGIISVPGPDDPAPGNMSVIEQAQMLVSVRAEASAANGFWLWVAVDNLRLAARNASACALELVALRPAGKVQ
jgi:aspartate-semialdehyde dehydrogenase